MPGLPEPAVVRGRAEHDDGDRVALRQTQQCGQAVAGLADEIRSSLAAKVMRCDRSNADETLLAFRPDGSANDVLCSPSSIAFSFMRSTNAAVPPCEVRASARAAPLSDGISSRCSSSDAVILSFALR